MHSHHHRLCVRGAVAICTAFATSQAWAETAPLESQGIAVSISSGVVSLEETGDDAAGERQVIYSTEVSAPKGTPWMRIHFGQAMLSGDIGSGSHSVIRMTSLKDEAVQIFNATHLAEWNFGSAYFNGGALRVELLSFPGTGPNELSIQHLTAGLPQADGGIASQCGPTDDRISSNDAAVARILPVGCTGWLFKDGSNHCLLTAGHCSGNMQVVEFNVPASNPNGGINFAHPDDQYSVDSTSIQSVFGGVGNDWGYFGTFSNPNTGLPPRIAQGAAYPLPESQPPANFGVLRVTGYGVDDGIDNQTQQTDTGFYDDLQATHICYDDLDTQGGNSGSPVLNNSFGIGIHTHGGCAGSCNRGTRIDNAGLQNALANPQGICTMTACTGDADGNGQVDVNDLLQLLAYWGPCIGCALDLDGNNLIGVSDLLLLLALWGECP